MATGLTEGSEMTSRKGVKPTAVLDKTPTQPVKGQCLGFFQFSSGVEVFKLEVPKHAAKALIQAERAPIRWRCDGVDPEQYVGMRLAPGESIELTDNLAELRFVSESSVSIMNVSFFA